jgi:predicted Zn-dependent peptidase
MIARNRFVQHRLPNGLTVVIEVMPEVQSAACGFLARTGSRDDPPALAGASHFLEHMCFKGTAHYTAAQLNIAFDEIGADNNAQTGKDQTFYYSWARTDDLGRQIELLAEMMRPTLLPDDFETERQVILEEIASYKDDLVANAYDFLYETVCPQNALAWPVLGYDRTISVMPREGLQAYLADRYRAANLVLVVAGNVDPDKVILQAAHACGDWEPGSPPSVVPAAPVPTAGVGALPFDRFRQQAVVLAFPSAPAIHPLDETAEAVAAILGGTNSRFYWDIVQQGLATRASAVREEYADFGLLILYALCEPDRCETVVEAMRREAERITREGPAAHELQRVRNLRRTSLMSEAESPGHRIGQIADDVHYRGAPRPAEARLAEVEQITSDHVAAYLQDYPITGDGCLVSVGPRHWPVL